MYRMKDPEKCRQIRIDAANARWENRGRSKTVRVDIAAADALLQIPERDRRMVATAGIWRAVAAYRQKKLPLRVKGGEKLLRERTRRLTTDAAEQTVICQRVTI